LISSSACLFLELEDSDDDVVGAESVAATACNVTVFATAGRFISANPFPELEEEA
jgi:hypothetical protein